MKEKYTIVVAKTDGGDSHVFLYKNGCEPGFEGVIRKVYEIEGNPMSLDWYLSTTSVYYYNNVEMEE